MSLGGTKAGRHTSHTKYIILKSGYSHENSSKAKAHGRDRKPLLIHYNHMEMSIFSVLEKKTLWMICFLKIMKKNTAWHLILAAVRVQYEKTEISICVETRRIICLFNMTVQMSPSKA